MEGQAARSIQQPAQFVPVGPAPTGQLAIAGRVGPGGPAATGQLTIASPNLASTPAPTQVINLPPVRGRNRRTSAGRVVFIGLAVIGLVLGTISLIGEPAASARSAEQDELGSEIALAESDATAATPAEEAEPVESGSESTPDDEPGDVLDDVAVGIDADEPSDVLDDIAREIGAADADDDAAEASDTAAEASDTAAGDDGDTEAVAPATPGVVYLTFDDGPHPEHTPAVLDVLARHNAKGTFFVLGSLAEAHPELIDRIVAEGHTVANHSWAHQDLAEMNQQQFNESVGRTQAALGEHATACLRPPYGSMTANTRAWAAELGLDVILWDTDTLDWQKPGADVVAETIVNGASNGPNILLHDGGGDRTESVRALDLALTELSGSGFSFEPICR